MSEYEELRELKRRKIEAEIRAFEAEARKNDELANNAELETKFRERRLAEELSTLEEARVFHFFGPINHQNYALAIDEIGTWSRRDPGCDITVVFNSPGGGVWEGLALYDFLIDLRRRKHKIITKSIGRAASMGAVLLQAGDERIMSSNGFMLIHEISSGAMGKASEIEDTMKLVEKLQDKLLNILSSKSKMTKTQIKRAWKRKDDWFDAEEALKLGFVDKIES